MNPARRPTEDRSDGGLARGRVPLGLLGALALVLGFESFLASHDSDFTDLSATDWRLTGKAIDSPEVRQAKVLLFGDSLIKFGVVPDLLGRRTGLPTFNLSVLGGQGPSTYFAFRRALEAGARPRAVVLDCQDLPSVVGFDKKGLGLWAHVRNWPELLRPREMLELARSAGESSLLGAIGLRRLLPSFKARNEVRTHLLGYLKKGASRSRYYAIIQKRNWKANRGSLIWGPKKEDRTVITPEQMASPPSNWAVDPITAEYLEKFLALADDRGIRVFFLIPPTSPEHQGLRDRVGQHEYYSRLARDLAAGHPGLVVVDGRRSGYGRNVFFDDSHLDRVGAVAFTDDVAGVIVESLARGPGGPGWVDLPRFRDRGPSSPIEDFDQSRIAIDNQWSRRR